MQFSSYTHSGHYVCIFNNQQNINQSRDQIKSLQEIARDLRNISDVLSMCIIIEGYDSVLKKEKIKKKSIMLMHDNNSKYVFSDARKIFNTKNSIEKRQIQIINTTAVVAINEVLKVFDGLDKFLISKGY